MTVEVTSPELIEKARTAITDESGQYRIVDLRAGAYAATFTLTGFSTVKREGIELTGSFTTVVNADLKVGALAETITVSGETPIVDTQSVRRQTTISGDLITTIPSARAYAGLMTLMPNTVVATGAASDVQVVPGMAVFGGAGGRPNEGRLQLDGISVGSAFNGGGVSAYIADVGNAQEVAMTTSGGLGEAEVGGPSLNVVPKTGGNAVPGTLYGDRVNELELRLAKNIRIARVRTNVGIDVYNVCNSASVLTYDQAFVLPTAANPNGSWLAPTSVLQARFVKVSAQIDF